MNRGKMDDLGAERKHTATSLQMFLNCHVGATQKEVKNINLHCVLTIWSKIRQQFEATSKHRNVIKPNILRILESQRPQSFSEERLYSTTIRPFVDQKAGNRNRIDQTIPSVDLSRYLYCQWIFLKKQLLNW